MILHRQSPKSCTKKGGKEHEVSCHHSLGHYLDHYIANQESPRTTKLYDRGRDEISLDAVERILI